MIGAARTSSSREMAVALHVESFARLVRAGGLDLAACIHVCRHLGVTAIELMDMLIADADLPDVTAALAATHMRVCSYLIHCNLITPDRFRRESEVARIRVGLERAAGLCAPVALVIPGAIAEGISSEQAQQWFAEALIASLPAARHLGLRLAIENIGMAAMATYCGLSAHLNAIHQAVREELGIVYDVGNFVLAGEDPLAALQRLRAPILHVHVKDWHLVDAAAPQDACAFQGQDDRHYMGAILGEGIVPLRAVLAALRAQAYAGALSVEYEGPERPDTALPRALATLQHLLHP